MGKAIGRIGMIGGSGLGEALAGRTHGEARYEETPFGYPSGPVVLSELEGVEIAFLARHGEGHWLNPSSVPYRANIYALKRVGVTHIIAGGATGSLAEEIAPRELVIPDQVIDKTFKRQNSFFDGELAVHVDFAYPFCERLRRLLLSAAGQIDARVHEKGTYVCMEGPQFSTRAESQLHRAWGGHLIGMTVMPEAKLAREAEICYALVALPTDYDCWRDHKGNADKHDLLSEIVGHLQAATQNAIQLITRALTQAEAFLSEPCEHHQALEPAIWTDKGCITEASREKLGLLIGKYL